MNSILFSSQKRTNGKRRKSHRMFVFAQDMGIRNWVRIPLASTPLPPFTTAKKTWEQASYNFLFKMNAQTQSLLPQIWGLEIWSRKCFRLQPSPTPCKHLHLPRKSNKRNSNFLCWKTSSSSILNNEKKQKFKS
jgi:hypothetical protein